MKNVVIILLGILIISCSSNDTDIEQNLYYYDQTGCTDPWNTGSNDSNDKTALELRKYFKSLEVIILDVSFEDISKEGEYSCDACTCLTGTRIIINIHERDSEKVVDVGFEKMLLTKKP